MAEPDFSQGQGASHVAEVLPAEISRDASLALITSTNISVHGNGQESRKGLWAVPRQEWDIGPGVRTIKTMRLVEAFHAVLGGPRDSFLFHNFLYHTTGQAAALKDRRPAAITKDDQIIGTGDAVEVAFQMVITFSTPLGATVQKNITRIKGTPLIALDGVFQDPAASPPPYTLNAATGIVTFASPPGDGVVISAGFEYYIRVRFLSDRLDVNIQNYDRGVPSIKLIEVKDFA